ncbi:MAG: methyltransferase domain-containing protein [Candidatus Omnitrophica bacterium]|nr:methyltransferase domain-containing protein [Candidatus Omnitrophota bacterium]
MINTSLFFEKFLQNYRFKMVRPYLIGDVLDFGGNEGEIKSFVTGKYTVVNYDHSVMENVHCDTIISLAVIEHIPIDDVYKIFKKFKTILNHDGRIFLTTPTKAAKPVLEFLTFVGILDKANIDEHKYYWSKQDIYDLAQQTGFKVKKYKRFQCGFNQLAIFENS